MTGFVILFEVGLLGKDHPIEAANAGFDNVSAWPRRNDISHKKLSLR